MKKIFLFITIMFLTRGILMAQIPDFTKTDCNGVTHHLYDDLSAGNAVVINVCAGWCQPCRRADPKLDTVYKQYCSGPSKLKVYGLLYNTNTVFENTNCSFGTQYASEENLSYPIIIDCIPLSEQYIKLYDPQSAIPLFVIIIPNTANPSNSTVYTIVGDYENLRDSIIGKLQSAGYAPNPLPVIAVTGNICTGPLTLSSNSTTGNHWSTGETTQNIAVTASGTYTLTINNGTCDMSVSKTFDLNPVALVGTAAISTNSICAGGVITLNYTVPAGYTGKSIWQYATTNNSSLWQDYVPADLGNLLLNTAAGDLVGNQYLFRVKAQPGNNEACALYSNTVYLTIIGAQPTTASGIASSSKVIACVGSTFKLSYTANDPGAIWELYSDLDQDWLPQFNANQGPVTLDATTNGNTTVDGFRGDRFRVLVPNGDCFAISNEVAVGYSNPTPSINGPNQVCFNSGNITLSVSDAAFGNVYKSIVWSPGGQITSSITVNPSLNNQFTVNINDIYGCTASTSKTVKVVPVTLPILSSSASGRICQGSPVTLSFTGTKTIPACSNTVFGQWPVDAFSFSHCDQAIEQIVSDGYAGEYSSVNVEAGKLYIFFSLNADGSKTYISDNITITDASGTNVFSTGVNYTYFISGFTGKVRFYTHEPGCVSDSLTVRQRWAFCSSNPDAYGGYSWSPGGATTHSITVNPTVSSNYTLTFSNLDFFAGTSCGSGTVTTAVNVIPKSDWILDNDTDGYYPGIPISACLSPGPGYIIKTNQLPGDCNDNDASVNPGAVEVCGNGIDDNCNGIIDESPCYPCLNATNLRTTSITALSAQLNWTAVANAVQWQIQYKTTKQGTKWVDLFLTGNKRSLILTGLLSNQNYLWHIRAKCGNNWTDYSNGAKFITGLSNALSSVAKTQTAVEKVIEPGLRVYPNPSQGQFMLEMQLPEKDNSIVNIQVIDLTGQVLQTETASMLQGYLKKNMKLNATLAKGMYTLRIITGNKTYNVTILQEK